MCSLVHFVLSILGLLDYLNCLQKDGTKVIRRKTVKFIRRYSTGYLFIMPQNCKGHKDQRKSKAVSETRGCRGAMTTK